MFIGLHQVVLVLSSVTDSPWRHHKLSSSQLFLGQTDDPAAVRVSVCADMDATVAGCWKWTHPSLTVTPVDFSERRNFFHGRTHVISPPLVEPCPRAWRRGRTTGLTKSTRVSLAGMRGASWGWSWKAARRMDSSRSSASFSRAERAVTAANSTRRNSSWKSTIPRWLDSPPGTSMLWSNTAKTPSDSSASNKVRSRSFRTNFPAWRSFSPPNLFWVPLSF